MFGKRLSLFAGAFGLVVILASASGRAEEITPSHLAAAKQAVSVTKADRGFEDLLPSVSQQVQNQLITLRPDLYVQITDAVKAMALTVVNRRADLDNDIARIWAQAFTEDELKAITVFYQSPAGQKFLTTGPKVFADSVNAAKGWSDRVREELAEKSREELKRRNVDF
ncbi:MAG TPA: DUF2059 domain-containing protein [Bauldia sp.]|nr:DUF2059 domain-containing protein [Bauldia sp.]